jgi:hypothetical protein
VDFKINFDHMATDKNSFTPDLLRYPNSEERKKIFELFPELEQLHISYKSIDLQFDSTDIFIDYNDFEQWFIRLLNKLGDIRFSFIQLAYSFQKGIPDGNWKTDKDRGGITFFDEFLTEEHNANKFFLIFSLKHFIIIIFLQLIFYINVSTDYFRLISMRVKRTSMRQFQKS